MLTKEEISQMAVQIHQNDPFRAHSYQRGATWANEQNYIEIARLEAEKTELIAALESATDFMTYEDKLAAWKLLDKYGR